ncbi:methyl-accepting chemotaxis protein [Dethiosulfatarculus sandiegensis]|uniref:Membrane protein n=1 Tax=Dethiosulfatarculus sandiegensis TaxID=1429043 RepID=A0A0D2HJP5_9BACT|nr:methyl-accepting chemotaxis protein [Dethiosulfatarculus sandiegensis]KIX10873.1 membrane protein [Dethiosulfatarculus sandiegensis]
MSVKDIGIGKKIGGGFGVVLILLAVAGVMTFLGIEGIVANGKEVIEGNRLDGNLAQKEIDHMNWASKLNAFLNDPNITEINIQVDPKKCAFGKWYHGSERRKAAEQVPSLAPILAAMQEPHRALHESAAQIKKVFRQNHPGLRSDLWSIMAGHLDWAKNVLIKLNRVARDNDSRPRPDFTLGVQLDPEKCFMGRFLAKPATKKMVASFPALAKALKGMEKDHQTMHGSAATIESLIRQGRINEAQEVFQQITMPALAGIKRGLNKAIEAENELQEAYAKALEIFNHKTRPNLKKLQDLLHQVRAETKRYIMSDEVMLKSAEKTQILVSIVALAALILGIIIAFWITKAITKPLRITQGAVARVSEGDFAFTVPDMDRAGNDELGTMLKGVETMRARLSDTFREVMQAARNVAEAANQISQGNQDLSERTQTQASAIEETASAMEEMTASVRQNAENSEKADRLAKEAVTTAQQGDKAVAHAVAAMNEVKESSHKISKIIGVVNEIAFQTNLLALNAAVEAARAGESGRGFAVVAGEVRNLAGRSADAAKEIQTLITDSVTKVEQGNKMVEESGELLKTMIDNSEVMAQSIREISASSREQAQGAEEINEAITQMDNAVQQNAALVEEAAAASENQTSAAEELRSQMGQFKVLGETVAADMSYSQSRADFKSVSKMAIAQKEKTPESIIEEGLDGFE